MRFKYNLQSLLFKPVSQYYPAVDYIIEFMSGMMSSYTLVSGSNVHD